MKKRLNPKQIGQMLDLVAIATTDIMASYQADYTIDNKADDSPVTEVDISVSRLLEKRLPQIANFPVLSEENVPPNNDWMNWQTYWIIDPIDGTKQFIRKTGQFCICIALIHNNEAVFGLISAPTEKTTWFAQKGDNAVSRSSSDQIKQLDNRLPAHPVVALSVSMASKNIETLLDGVFSDFRYTRRGSALKYVDIVEGRATIYPRIRGTYEWDSAAGQCLLTCVGGQLVDLMTGEPLRYGDKVSLLNPHFLAYKDLSQVQLTRLLANYQRLDLSSL